MLAAGTTVGRYLVEHKIAEGGMAEIYLASAKGPEGFSKEVALKVVRSYLATDPQFVELFIAEARLASRLNHANIVQIFDFGKHDDTYYLAMEYVRGASLWNLRLRCREAGVPFPVTLAAEICAKTAAGLHAAHSLADQGRVIGVVHRDVSPHNVLLSFDGAVKLTDFGIAKATSTHTSPGVLKGKLAYMSPEQSRGDPIDARTDVFALGVVLWELLTGGRLFDGDTDLAVVKAVQQSAIAPPMRLNPDVPKVLSDVVMKALERSASDRFQSAFEFERALTNFVISHAKKMEDTAVGPFVQQMFREAFEPSAEPTPAQVDALPVPSSPLAQTVAARKSGNVGAMKTELPPAPRAEGAAARRFDPLPVPEPSVVAPAPLALPVAAAPAAFSSRVPLVLGGLALLGALAGAAIMARATKTPVAVVTPIVEAAPPPPPALDAAVNEPVAAPVVEAPAGSPKLEALPAAPQPKAAAKRPKPDAKKQHDVLMPMEDEGK
jgi:eukaryotic-like serine/threonine-protein kinase